MISQLLAGHYRILQVLGTGGFGQTYIAEDTHRPGNPKCVVKHLKPASSAPHVLEIARSLFQKEAETLERLGDHNQIPRLLAYFEENQEFYLVQEFIDGHPLSRELQPGKRWTENKIIEMLIEVLSILEFVHSQQVIHRDIKPDNIIRRDGDGKLVLIDFGAIKQVRNQTAIAPKQVSLTVSIGTPGYMPTEQSRGKPRPNSDIYALGMIGIQASTGVYPSKLHELYEDPDTGEILWQSLAAVSPSLAAILTKMTHYHFKDRYLTASEALEAVQQLAHPDTYTLQTTTIATTTQELTLEWVEAGIIKTRTIGSNHSGKNPGLRIGRDPQACDIVLSEPTVSGLHVEIFFNTEQQCFYLRCLRQSNPPLVDGHLTTKEVALAPGSSLRLGDLDLRVAAISVKQHPTSGEYIPSEYSTQPPSQPPQLVAKTLEPHPSTNLHSSVFPVTPPNSSVVPSAAGKLPLLIGLGVVGIVSVGGLAYMKFIPAQPELNTSQVKVTPSTSPVSSPTVAAKKTDVVTPVPTSIKPAKPVVASPVPSPTPAKPVVASPVPSVTPTKPVVAASPMPSVTPGIINNQNTPQPKETVKKIEQRSQQQPSDHSSDKSSSSSNPLPDSSKNSPDNQLDNEGMNILAEARVLAMEGDLSAAIIKAQQVSQASSAYPDAQNEKALWQQQLASQNAQSQQQDEGENLLAEARRLASDGNLAAAISKAEQVSQASSAYTDAQNQKALWQQLLTKQNVESLPSNQLETLPQSQNIQSPPPNQVETPPPNQNTESPPNQVETPLLNN